MFKRITCVGVVGLVVAVVGIGAPSAMASTPVSGISASVSCPSTVVGGQVITCDWSVTNSNSTNERCTSVFTWYESSAKKESSSTTYTLLANGGNASGTVTHRTNNSPAHHGGTLDMRTTCVDHNGEQTVEQARFTVQ